ncbi:MAG: leucyl/phenylalanyl-tRNA--protein transferase [Bacteroidetes bacterium]|nr:MAG: leucyl/phenylalanyl-tRNA--protein transferase [Bacteroidota bacterium]
MFWLDEELIFFPPQGLADKDGFLAVGGDLSVRRLLLAYRSGIFPWYDEPDPIMWFCPSPRFVLFPGRLKISSSMKKVIRSGVFEITFSEAFGEVMEACGRIPRPGQTGTWIGPEMLAAYKEMHRLGFAWSAEAWRDGKLAGGVYGVKLGNCFFGESMFSRESNASKTAFIFLVEKLKAEGCVVIDCQVQTKHLQSLGGEFIPLPDFLALLDKNIPPLELLYKGL